MDIAANILFDRMVDGLVIGVEVGDTSIGCQFVRHDSLGLGIGMLLDESVESFPICSFDDLQPNFPGAFDSSDDDGFVSLAAAIRQCFFSANPGLIDFNGPAKIMLDHFAHRPADSVAEIPRGLVRDSKSSFHLIGGHPLLGLDHKIHGGKPLPERKMGIMEDRPAGGGELVAA